jgi:hypothetical protein
MRILPTALLLTLAVAAPAQASKAPDVPAALQPPAANKVFMVGHATGVQIYSCNGTAWTFVAPRASLYNEGGQLKISHFAGPTWQHKDGSKVVGQAIGNVAVTPHAIPWLLLRAASTQAGAFGDKLAKTTYIQRVNTSGGLAPAAPCAASTQVEVPYTADYYFWRAK